MGRTTLDFIVEGAPDAVVLAAPLARVDSIFAGAAGVPSHPVPFRREGGDSVVVDLSELSASGIEVDDFLKLAIVFESSRIRFEEGAAWSLDNVEPWFPWSGDLGDRFTSELILTVPSNWIVFGPGVQTATRSTEDDRRTYLYSSPHALPAHRLGFLAGDFQSDVRFAGLSGGRRVPVTSLGDPAVPETATILETVSNWTGFAYPFERFGQLIQMSVAPAAAAGMAVLPPAAAADTRVGVDPSDVLSTVAARQWIGTVISAAGWPHVWFEEGFASYVGAVAADADLRSYLMSRKRAYLDEADNYRRPLVWRRWNHPAELYDAHASGKAAWVAHMIRRQVGSDSFREAVGHFIQANQFTSVETDALLHAFEDVAGADLTGFANQWIYAAGHPILDVSYEEVDDGLYVRLEQRQQGELVPTVFDLELTMEVGALGATERFSVAIDERVEEVVLPFSSRPRFVAVDPDDDWLLEASVRQPAPAWIAQLRYAAAPGARLTAARALAHVDPDPALLLGLRSALESDTDPAVRAEIAAAIANVGNEAADRAILAAFGDSSAVVRTAVLSALSEVDDKNRAVDVAVAAAQNDPSHLVQAKAVEVLAELGADNAVGIARSALITPSYDGVIRAAGLYALSLLHRQAPGDAVDAAGMYSAEGHTLRVRTAAIRLLGTLAPVNRQAAERLRDLLASPSFQVRAAAADELARIGSIGVLRERLSSERSDRFAAYLTSLIPCE